LGTEYDQIQYGIYVPNNTYVGTGKFGGTDQKHVYCHQKKLVEGSPSNDGFSLSPKQKMGIAVVANVWILTVVIYKFGHGIPTSVWWRAFMRLTTIKEEVDEGISTSSVSAFAQYPRMFWDIFGFVCFIVNIGEAMSELRELFQ